MITRRQALASVFALPVLALRGHLSPARELSPKQVAREIHVEEVDGAAVWRFDHFCTEQDHRPVEIGDRVYFDGKRFGSPTIEGVVTEIDQENYPACNIQHLTVRGDRA